MNSWPETIKLPAPLRDVTPAGFPPGPPSLEASLQASWQSGFEQGRIEGEKALASTKTTIDNHAKHGLC